MAAAIARTDVFDFLEARRRLPRLLCMHSPRPQDCANEGGLGAAADDGGAGPGAGVLGPAEEEDDGDGDDYRWRPK